MKNPVAKAVRTPAFRQRVVKSAKDYRRKPKHDKMFVGG